MAQTCSDYNKQSSLQWWKHIRNKKKNESKQTIWLANDQNEIIFRKYKKIFNRGKIIWQLYQGLYRFEEKKSKEPRKFLRSPKLRSLKDLQGPYFSCFT